MKQTTIPLKVIEEIILNTARQFDRWAQESLTGCWSTHQVTPLLEKSNELRETIFKWKGMSHTVPIEKITNLLEDLSFQLDSWAEESKLMGWSTHQVIPMYDRSFELQKIRAGIIKGSRMGYFRGV